MRTAEELFEHHLRALVVPKPSNSVWHAPAHRMLQEPLHGRRFFRTHASEGHEIAAVTEGRACIITPSETFDLSPGRLLFIDRGVEHAELPCESSSPYVLFWCYCDSTYARLDQTSYTPPSTYQAGPAIELPGRSSIIGIADAISYELQHRDSDWDCAVFCLLNYLRCVLTRRLHAGHLVRLRPIESPAICVEPRTWRIIQAALQYCDTNFRSNIRVADVAKAVGYSASHLSSLFSCYVGHSLADYIRDLRIRSAQDLLEKSDLTISEIAHAVGYKDPAHFTRAFTRRQGIAPKRYRENLRGV